MFILLYFLLVTQIQLQVHPMLRRTSDSTTHIHILPLPTGSICQRDRYHLHAERLSTNPLELLTDACGKRKQDDTLGPRLWHEHARIYLVRLLQTFIYSIDTFIPKT